MEATMLPVAAQLTEVGSLMPLLCMRILLDCSYLAAKSCLCLHVHGPARPQACLIVRASTTGKTFSARQQALACIQIISHDLEHQEAPGNMANSESRAVQTLSFLHSVARICHMDISLTNIMLDPLKSSSWDSVTIIDFGFAQEFDAGIVFCVRHWHLLLSVVECMGCIIVDTTT